MASGRSCAHHCGGRVDVRDEGETSAAPVGPHGNQEQPFSKGNRSVKQIANPANFWGSCPQAHASHSD